MKLSRNRVPYHSMMKLIDRKDIAPLQWDEIVRNSDNGWVFALSQWQDLILEVDEWKLEEHSFAVEVDGKLVAVVPLQFSPLRNELAISGWGGCGPVMRVGKDHQSTQRILSGIYEHCSRVAKSCSARSLQFTQTAVTRASLSNTSGVNAAVFHGFEDQSGLTQVVALNRDPEVLWRGLSKNARNIIRKAEKEGTRAEIVDWESHLTNYYALHCETYRRTGVNPHPFSYFAGIATKMASLGHSVLLAALDRDKKVIAYHNDAWYADGALYHTSCSSNSAQGSGANYLLLWKAMLAAQESGKTAYEVGNIYPNSVDLKQQGLTVFKTRFGGEPRRAFRSYKEFSQHDAQSIAPCERSGLPTRGFFGRNLKRVSEKLMLHLGAIGKHS